MVSKDIGTVNVFCVKVGNKYGPEYVNRLWEMYRRNSNHPFFFNVITDDVRGINVPFTHREIIDPSLEGYWAKLHLFYPYQTFPGTSIYFDLDTVIQNNFDDWLENVDDTLRGVYTYWHPLWTQDDLPPMFCWKTPFNSSILVWKHENFQWVWDNFQADKDFFICKYYGDDKFLGNEVKPLSYFPKGEVYSRLYGMGKPSTAAIEVVRIEPETSQELWRLDSAKVCMFNGPTTESFYQNMEHYWA
jgi:hypothetical protein